MERGQQENGMWKKEVCLICLQNFNDSKKSFGIDTLIQFQNDFNRISKYLSSKIFARYREWNFVRQGDSPLCLDCHSSVKKIANLNEQLEKLQNAIKDTVNSFTNEVLVYHDDRTLNDVNEHDGSDSNDIHEVAAKSGAACVSDDRNIQIKEERFLSDQFDCEVEVEVETTEFPNDEDERSENSLNFGSSYSNDNRTFTHRNNASHCYLKTSKYPTDVVDAPFRFVKSSELSGFQHAPLKQLKLVLNRLLLDSEGKPVIDKENNDARPRRKTTSKVVKAESSSDEEEITSRIITRKRPKTLRTTYHKGDNGTGDKNRTDQVQCKICKKELTRKALLYHMTIHSGKLPYHCDICGKSFRRVSYLKEHKTMHSGDKPFECKTCGKSFRLLKGLRFHEVVHAGEKRFKCEVCEKSFFTVHVFRRHKKCHLDKSYKCHLCSRSYSFPAALESHLKGHEKNPLRLRVPPLEGESRKTHTCKSCDKNFSRPTLLVKHELIHTGERPFVCEICDKDFRTKTTFRVHQKTHLGVKAFKCQVCERCFTEKRDMQRHESTHSGEKHCICEICGKAFRLSVLLTRHIKHSHVNPNPNLHSCSVCFKKFAKADVLARHEKKHAGLKPYQCTECDRAFTKSLHLNKHVANVHRTDCTS